MKRLNRLWGVFKWSIRSLGMVLGILLLAVLVGIPGEWLTPILNRMPLAAPIEMDRLRWVPGSGWNAMNVEVYAPHDHVTPWLEIPVVTLRTDFWHWIQTRTWRGDVELSGGEVVTTLGSWVNDLRTYQRIRIQAIEGRVGVDASHITLQDFSAHMLGIDLHIEGAIPRSLAAGSETSTSNKSGLQWVSALATTIDYLEEFEYIESPGLKVSLAPTGQPDDPVSASVQLSFSKGAMRRGYRFESIGLQATYQYRRLQVNSLELMASSSDYLRLNAEVNLDQDQLDLEIHNTLQRYVLEAVSPVSLDSLLSDLQLRLEGKSHFTLQVEEGQLQKPWQRVTIEVDAEEVFYKDTFFPELRLTCVRDQEDLILADIEGQLGKGKGSGPISGEIQLGDQGERVDLQLAGAFYPAQAIPLLGPNTERIIRDWEFRGLPPEFMLRYRQISKTDPMEMDLEVTAADAWIRGTSIQTGSFSATIRDEVLVIDSLEASRGTHTLQGSITYPLDGSRLEMSMMSTFPPQDLAPFLGQEVMNPLRPVRFEGKNWMQFQGTLDFTGKNQHDLAGKFVCNQLTYGWIQFRYLSSSFALKGQDLRFPDIDGMVVNGYVKGNLAFMDLFKDSGVFLTQLRVSEADLFQMITAATDKPDTPYSGKLSLDLNLDGRLRPTPGKTLASALNGNGKIAIDQGSLFQVPLLLGLSRILSKVVSGFGYASQTDFTADFHIKNGVISSENLFLRGNLLSIGGEGSYEIGGKLGCTFKVQLLNKGVFSEALKLVLWPIRKLIEIQLTGTLDDPDWQPRNLPKELFGK